MSGAYLFLAFGLVSFAAMGICHKLADRYRCDPLTIALATMASAVIFTVLNAVTLKPESLSSLPFKVALIAVPFGICAAAAIWFFQRGLPYGKIATSWLFINLSSAVPTVLSIIVYREPLNLKKFLVLAMIVASLLLLWWDRYQERGAEAASDRPAAGSIIGGEG